MFLSSPLVHHGFTIFYSAAGWLTSMPRQVSTIALWGRSMGAATALLHLGTIATFIRNGLK